MDLSTEQLEEVNIIFLFITYSGPTRSIFQEVTPTWLHINGALLICIPDLTQ